MFECATQKYANSIGKNNANKFLHAYQVLYGTDTWPLPLRMKLQFCARSFNWFCNKMTQIQKIIWRASTWFCKQKGQKLWYTSIWMLAETCGLLFFFGSWWDIFRFLLFIVKNNSSCLKMLRCQTANSHTVQRVFLFLKFIKIFIDCVARSVFYIAMHSTEHAQRLLFTPCALAPFLCSNCRTTQMRSPNFTLTHKRINTP